MSKLLFAHHFRLSADGIKLAGFLLDRTAVFINFDMAARLNFNRLHHELDRIDVFHFTTGAQLIAAGRADGNVDVAAH